MCIGIDLLGNDLSFETFTFRNQFNIEVELLMTLLSVLNLLASLGMESLVSKMQRIVVEFDISFHY